MSKAERRKPEGGATTMTARGAQIERYREAFNREPGTGPAWLQDLRHAAIARFCELGFPTTRDEEWRSTSVAPIAEAQFALANGRPGSLSSGLTERFALGGTTARLVFVNGRYAPALSQVGQLPDGVRVTSLHALLDHDSDVVAPYLARQAVFGASAFTALNTAFARDGACVLVPSRVVLERPIHVLFLSSAPSRSTATHPRLLVVAGERSQLTIVEHYAGLADGVYFTNAVSEIAAGPAAVVDHYKVQQESLGSYHIGAMHVRAERDSRFSSHSISLGGALVRNDATVLLGDQGVDCALNGLYFADGTRLVDNHTTVDHAHPRCDSRELYKGILSGRARAVFNGKIIVRPDAQQTDAKQTNKALLLSDDALINTKPQLEIFANDVKCTHGAAVGQVDEEALFYLRARGLTQPEARTMLIRAFAGEVLGRVKIVRLRDQLEQELLAKLPQ